MPESDNQEEATDFDGGAKEVQPGGLAHAPVIDEGEDADEREDHRSGVKANWRDRLPSRPRKYPAEGARLRRHRGQARRDDCQSEQVREEGPAKGTLGDVGDAGGARMARPERSVRKPGQQRRDHAGEESEPDRIAHDAGNLADQRVDPRAEHVADAVDDERAESHRADEGRLGRTLRR